MKKEVKESTPINYVLQVKMSGNPIPYEYGFTTEQEARDMREEFEYSDNPRLRWTDILKRNDKQYQK